MTASPRTALACCRSDPFIWGALTGLVILGPLGAATLGGALSDFYSIILWHCYPFSYMSGVLWGVRNKTAGKATLGIPRCAPRCEAFS